MGKLTTNYENLPVGTEVLVKAIITGDHREGYCFNFVEGSGNTLRNILPQRAITQAIVPIAPIEPGETVVNQRVSGLGTRYRVVFVYKDHALIVNLFDGIPHLCQLHWLENIKNLD